MHFTKLVVKKINLKKFLLVKYFFIVSIFFLSSCTGSYTHRSGNNSNLSYDSRICKAHARVVAPTYLCRNPLMCAPDETSIALASIIDNAAAYDLCMLKKGYDEVR